MRTLLLCVSLLSPAACGAGTGRCDFRPKEARCQEREGLPTTLVAFEQLCKTSGGQYTSGACDRQGSIGGCDISEVANPVRDFYYTDAAHNLTTADHVKAKCGSKPFIAP